MIRGQYSKRKRRNAIQKRRWSLFVGRRTHNIPISIPIPISQAILILSV